MLVLNKSAVSSILSSISLEEILSNQAQVFQTLSDSTFRSTLQSPHRTSIQGKESTMLFMPSAIQENRSIKIVGVPTPSDGKSDDLRKDGNHENKPRGLQACSLIFDEFGRVEALIDSSLTTAVRTSAGEYRA